MNKFEEMKQVESVYNLKQIEIEGIVNNIDRETFQTVKDFEDDWGLWVDGNTYIDVNLSALLETLAYNGIDKSQFYKLYYAYYGLGIDIFYMKDDNVFLLWCGDK